MILIKLKAFLNRYSKTNFIYNIPKFGNVLDVGCGNDSPYRLKLIRSDLHYTGIDIYDLNTISSKKAADIFIKSDELNFNNDLIKLGKYDSIICSHVIEHVKEYAPLITIMIDKLKDGGQLYLSYPTLNSTNFPSRKGTLNFYDDNTHISIINSEIIKEILKKSNCKYKLIISNKPRILWLIGLILEPYSIIINRNAPFGTTWAYYGFEDIFIIKKNETNNI
jgi:2-polyprenyl-3-methyl-5-hydroxy-6-metoxy-1,4-benzoquinol methylase